MVLCYSSRTYAKNVVVAKYDLATKKIPHFDLVLRK